MYSHFMCVCVILFEKFIIISCRHFCGSCSLSLCVLVQNYYLEAWMTFKADKNKAPVKFMSTILIAIKVDEGIIFQ